MKKKLGPIKENSFLYKNVESFAGVKILLVAVILLRFVGMVMGCFYGPYIYIVLPLGGLYLAADGLLLNSVKGGLLHSKRFVILSYL
jgi:hypothetical protein